MRYVSFSETGLVRAQNEDFVWCDPETGLFVVADGMGGHQSGDIAARLAIGAIRETFQAGGAPGIPETIRRAIENANTRIHTLAARRKPLMGMGTTVSLVVLEPGQLHYGHVGDSRIYLLGAQGIRQISRDHTMVEELVLAGTISPDEARFHPRKNVLLRALGTEEEIDIDAGTEPLAGGETVLLTTDGVHAHVSADELEAVFRDQDLGDAAEAVRKQVFSMGAADNLSLIAVRPGEQR